MNRKKAMVLVSSLVLLLSLILVLSTREKPQDIDNFPEEATALDTSKYANIVGETSELAQKLGGVTQYDLLAADMHYFGKVTYDNYRKGVKKVIGFNIDKKIEQNGAQLTFSGKYGSSKNRVVVYIELLENRRIKTKITDKSLNKTMDNDLPSSSDFNKLIASLPISKDRYLVEYSVKKDSIVIDLLERDPTIVELAMPYIKSLVRDGTFDEKRVDIIFPPDSVGF